MSLIYMRTREYHPWRLATMLLLVAALVTLSTRMRADTGMCGGASITIPFNDVPSSNIFFCSIASAYFSGLTNGTTSTTYSPTQPVPREQMAAFVSRTLDQSLRRGSRRAALNQWWTPTAPRASQRTAVGDLPRLVACDGSDLWVANEGADNTVSRVRASDGRLLETWTGAINAFGVLVAEGRVYITGNSDPGQLYVIDPRNAAGAAFLLTDNLGSSPHGIAYDSARIWTANSGGSVSIVTHVDGSQPQGGELVNVTTVSTGFVDPVGMLYDGSNIWVTDTGDDRLKKLNADASVAVSVSVGDALYPVFDGTNIWVPDALSNTVTVVRVKDTQGKPLAAPFVLATLTGNGIAGPGAAAFDGQRILVAKRTNHSVSLWLAADLTPLGSVSIGPSTTPYGACSDGVNFWVTLLLSDELLRF